MNVPFDNSYSQLPPRFYERQVPAQVPDAQLIRANAELAEILGIDPEWLLSAEGVAMMAGNAVEEGSDPISQVYAGHQFGGFNPRLGDGRAILLGEVIDRDGVRRDIQLKGAGRTPFSRGGDGKTALGPALREYLLSEAMAALGVPTTRALGVVSTGEIMMRHDGPQPGAVFTRVAASHVRVGTFQYFAAQQDEEAVRMLADYCIARHYPECLGTADEAASYVAFFQAVVRKQANLIAHWMSLGFIHGVMNTDNCAISGETIDYGPCAFMDDFHPDAVFSSIDANGRYAWGNQPNIGVWNMSRLAECLLPLFHTNSERAQQIAEGVLSAFSERFNTQYLSRFRAKFCLPDTAPETIIQDALTMLANQKVDFTLFFRQLTLVASGDDECHLKTMFDDQIVFQAWLKMWKAHMDADQYLLSMKAANPVFIPRNHRVEEVIRAAKAGDYSLFHRLHEALESPYVNNVEYADLEKPPLDEELVRETFCGT